MDFDKLSLDYQQVNAYWRTLAEIRFKLLAIVPTLTGIGVTFLAEKHTPETETTVGLLGLLATLGLTFYDQRNTQHYNDAVKRAKRLEGQLGLSGGIFSDRPHRSLKLFGLVLMYHDRALCLVYASALGAWSYVVISAILRMFKYQSPVLSVVFAVTLGILFYIDLIAKDEDVDQVVS